MKKIFLVFLMLGFFSFIVFSAGNLVRIKDIARIDKARDNQLMGFGLVVGLKQTGDTQQTGFTQQALTNLLSRMGVVPENIDFKSRNTAAVMATAILPPFVKPGQKIDVVVSSLGDASSLAGGSLLLTPLQGVDTQIYAVAQGKLVLDGMTTVMPVGPVRNREYNSGRIPSGALVEKEVPVTFSDVDYISILLNEPDFTSAARIKDAVERAGFGASAYDAATIRVSKGKGNLSAVEMIARIENLKIIPDEVAAIVINEKTGTIVIGENVVIQPVAVAYEGLNLVVGPMNLFSEKFNSSTASQNDVNSATSTAKVFTADKNFELLQSKATLSGLVNALNKMGAKPKDLITILQAIKEAGALKAELKII